MAPSPSDVTDLAPRRTPLGDLQRGLGAGFLWAIRESREAVWPIVERCLRRAPVWNWQVDSRGHSFAEIILRTGMPIDALRAGFITELRQSSPLGTLARQVLTQLARRGHRPALEILQASLALRLDDPEWDSESLGLLDVGVPGALGTLGPRILARFDDEALAWELPGVDGGEPWVSWAAAEPRVAKVFQARREKPAPSRAPADRARLRGATTQELLEIVRTAAFRDVLDELASRTGDEDVALLWRAARGGEPAPAARALRVLAQQRHPGCLELSIDWLNRLVGVRLTGPQRGLRFAATEAFSSSAAALPVARERFDDPDPTRRRAAEKCLALHATDDDVSRLRTELHEVMMTDDPYRLGSIVEALARFPHRGPFPELRSAFETTPFSYTRHRIAKALSAVEPTFPRELGVECLWDCEPETRRIGCESVERDVPGVAARLRELADDRHEEPEVVAAAASSLAR